jgi:hypothetical protein
MDFATVDYTPVAPFTPLAVLAVLILGIAACVLMDRVSMSRRQPKRAAEKSPTLAKLAKDEFVSKLSTAHLIRRRFQIG